VSTDDDRPFEDDDELVVIARSLTVSDMHLDTPPHGVWAAIEARLSDLDRDDAEAAPLPARAEDRPPRWRSTQMLAVAAAALIVVVGGVATIALLAGRGDGSRAVERVALVNTDLDPAGAASSGQAKLVRLRDGRYALDVRLQDLPDPADGFLELWLLDPDAKGMVSLGPVVRSTRVVLPANVDPATYPIVDVSVEPTDGLPTHSGVSILRGRLTV